ncbi:MAG TPA: VWA domain-containing protein [Conexibacter sp.]|jgi:uncharacterized protein YegL
MRVADPWLLLLLLPLAALALTLSRRRPVATRRDLVARLLRWGAGLLLVLALAQPQLTHGSGRPTMLVIDRSASIDGTAGRREAKWLEQARKSGPVARDGVVVFGGTSRLQRATAPLAGGAERAALAPGESDLAGALALALGRVPQGGRVVVLSDGAVTGGDSATSAALARSRAVAVYGVQLADGRRDAAVARLQAPDAVHSGDPLPLQATINATVDATATVTLRRDGAPAGSQRLALRAGDTPLQLALTAPRTPGEHSYQLSVAVSGDEITQNDTLDAAVRVAPQPRVLVAAQGDSALTQQLATDGINASAVAPADLPTNPAFYTGVDAVVLDDVSATALGSARQGALVEAVRGGLGLVAFGGPDSFSLGRYAGSPIDAALPVASLRPGNQQQRDLALELVLDRSGSMADVAGGISKIGMAQAAARVGARFAAAHRDQFGIVSFDITPRVLIPLAPLPRADVPRAVRTIDGLRADGGTDIYLGLRQAAEQIEQSQLPQRHMILMSDGVSEDANYEPLLRRLASEHVTVSTVALGGQADTRLLQRIASATRGRYYQTTDAHQLPRIFARDARRTARPTRVRGRVTVTPGADSPVVESLAGRALPPLRENVVTTPRPGAQVVLLGANRGGRTDPVLAQWQYGSGRVVAWTPGVAAAAVGPWAGEARLWQDATRWAQRAPSTPALTPTLAADDSATVLVDPLATADTPLDLASLAGTITGPDRRTAPLRFSQTSPSAYTASVGPLAPGLYRASVIDRDGDLPSANALLAAPYPAEYLPRPAGSSALGPLTAATGGRLLDPNDPGALTGGRTTLWWWLALAASGVFLAAVAVRLLPQTRAAPPRTPQPQPRARAGRQG